MSPGQDRAYGPYEQAYVLVRATKLLNEHRWTWQIWCFNYYHTGWSRVRWLAWIYALTAIATYHAKRFAVIKARDAYLRLQSRWHVLPNEERLTRW